MSGLDLRRRESVLKGGGRGPSVVPGNAQESLLFLAASHTGELKMPPQGSALSSKDVAILRVWIDQGAPWSIPSTDQQEEPSWWSFRTPQRPAVPKAKEEKWVRNPIDAFILAKLEEKGLPHAPLADKRKLIRRATFDLIGLPPTPEEVENFLNDPSPNAYANRIDELLRSPHYGERWGRYWLDVVRYGDTSGFETDLYLPNAWRYRNYVIKSFNEDKPYDRFVQEQIAADELWPDDMDLDGGYAIPLEKMRHLEARVGTGLYGLTPQTAESGLEFEKDRYDRLTDWVNTTGAAFMGLTLACARCHDHKFDPLSQRDYFRLQAIFAASQIVDIPLVTRVDIVLRESSQTKVIALDERREAYRRFEERLRKRIIETRRSEFAPEVLGAYEIPKEQRTFLQRKMVEDLLTAIQSTPLEKVMTPEEQQEQGELYEELAKAVLALPEGDAHTVEFDGLIDVPRASVLAHRQRELLPDVHVLDRGNLGRKKEKVSPGLPAVLSGGMDQQASFSGPEIPRGRKSLALWLTQPDHPLTSRVMVNRIWQGHFGRGLVATPNDFGQMGQAPTHPQLLDWLASEFVAQGWSLKSIHRLILLSNTYQMSSQYQDPEAQKADPDNSLLWRANRRRLDAEILWDSVHAAAGTLNLKMGGRPVRPPFPKGEQTGNNWNVSLDPADRRRRGVYILVQRNFGFPMFETFDGPDPVVSCPTRQETTVAPQSLYFMNSETLFGQAQEFADRLVREKGDHPPKWVKRAWYIALGRAPSLKEKGEALELLASLTDREVQVEDWPGLDDSLIEIGLPRAAALTQLCLAIFNLSEFSYVD